MGANATPMPIGEVYTGAEDRPDRRRREQLSRRYDSFKHFEAVKFYSQDRALDGARDAADVQDGLRQAAARPSRRCSAQAAKESVPSSARSGTSRKPSRSPWSRPAAPRSSRSTRRRSRPRWSRSTTSSSPTPDLKRLVKARAGHEVMPSRGLRGQPPHAGSGVAAPPSRHGTRASAPLLSQG